MSLFCLQLGKPSGFKVDLFSSVTPGDHGPLVTPGFLQSLSYTKHWVTWALEWDQLAIFKTTFKSHACLLYYTRTVHFIQWMPKEDIQFYFCIMYGVFNGDQEHVKTASLGCTDVEKYNSLYTEEKEMRYSRYVRASCNWLPCSFAFTGNPQSLEWATLFITVLRMNFRYTTPLSL